MTFLCQKFPYLKELTSKVLTCEPTTVNKGLKAFKGFDVTLDETLFFAEGGGQPADYGTIGEESVKWVYRDNGKVVHQVENKLDVGSTFECKLDWSRRFDHMQHHSGQHLISAVLESDYNMPTLSWELGSTVCNVEVSMKESFGEEDLYQVEKKVNDLIRQALPITLHQLEVEEAKQYFSKKNLDVSTLLETSNLLTFIEIQNVDYNMCCGTHLKNTSEMQMIKLLGYEVARGNLKITFIIGGRVLEKLTTCLSSEKILNKLLNCGQKDYVERIESMKKNEKALEKFKTNMMKTLAAEDAQKCISDFSSRKFQFIHKKEFDNTYLATFVRLVKNKVPDDCVLFVACGPEKGPGVFFVKAHSEFFDTHSNKIFEDLSAKGKVVNNVLNGKSSEFTKIELLSQYLHDFYS